MISRLAVINLRARKMDLYYVDGSLSLYAGKIAWTEEDDITIYVYLGKWEVDLETPRALILIAVDHIQKS